jgi:hypothetical protein
LENSLSVYKIWPIILIFKIPMSLANVLHITSTDKIKKLEEEFQIKPSELDQLIKARSLALIENLGGVENIAKCLKTDIKSGISKEEKKDNFSERKTL